MMTKEKTAQVNEQSKVIINPNRFEWDKCSSTKLNCQCGKA